MPNRLTPALLGQLARTAREGQKRSQKSIARELEVSQTTLHKMEAGHITDSKHWPRLFTVLGLPLSKLDPIYSDIPDARAPVRVLSGTGQPSVTSNMVAVNVTREAHLITAINYEVVEYELDGATRQGLLITWTAKNGASLVGLVDRAMLPSLGEQARRCYQELGIDLAKQYASAGAD